MINLFTSPSIHLRIYKTCQLVYESAVLVHSVTRSGAPNPCRDRCTLCNGARVLCYIPHSYAEVGLHVLSYSQGQEENVGIRAQFAPSVYTYLCAVLDPVWTKRKKKKTLAPSPSPSRSRLELLIIHSGQCITNQWKLEG
jgi:hypothetical protein